MSSKPARHRSAHWLIATVFAFGSGSAAALEFEFGDTTVVLDNLVTIGATWRAQDRDNSLIGKSTLHRLNNPGSTQGLCYTRADDDGKTFPGPTVPTDDQTDEGYLLAGLIPAACGTSNYAANLAYVRAPGSMSPNGDNANLSFEKGDIVSAVSKLTSDLSFEMWDFNIFARGIYYFDATLNGFEMTHPDTTFQNRKQPLASIAESRMANKAELTDYNISRVFEIGERDLSVKLGRQVLNWGESSLLVLNSLNSINPPNAVRIGIPGFDLKEAFEPVGMLVINTDIMDNVGLEAFYEYEWRPVVLPAVGSFFSPSDTLGEGGSIAMLSFGKIPDDPDAVFEGVDTCPTTPGTCVDVAGTLGSTSSRTVFRDFAEEKAMEPTGGAYGFAIKTFLEDFNNGTELNFYFANYDSRLPVASAFAAQAGCIETAADLAPAPVGGCDVVPASHQPAGNEPLPVDTVRAVVHYPEDIHMYGMSFNTTVGDYAISGEYAFRDNLPVQIHTTDLLFAALQPVFPEADVSLGPAGTLGGRRSAVPDFITQFRDPGCGTNCIEPGEFIPGYERQKVGQANLTFLRLIGGDNILGASQVTILFETGMQQVFDMPGLDQLQFNGGGINTHISGGADCTFGIQPADVRTDPNDTRSAANNCDPNNLPADTDTSSDAGTRQNPTAQKDYKGFGTSESYGYRLINLNRWDSALFGANLETLFIARHDVKGTSPGIGTNFLHGRKQFNFGLRFTYLSAWAGEVRYTWFTGGGGRDGGRDNDNLFAYVGYTF